MPPPPPQDPRFSKVNWDPRFAPPRKSKQSKVQIDDRFKSLLKTTDSNSPGIDRYGRRRRVNNRNEGDSRQLERLYDLQDQEDEEEEYDPARGKGLISSSSEEEEEEEESDQSDIDEESLLETAATTTQDIEQGEASNRLALVNLDWDNVNSTDLMVSLSSFVPAKGRILSVKIFPSQYGKELMEREEVEGPPKEIFDNDDDNDASSSSSSSDDDDDDDDENPLVKPDDGQEVNSSQLRRYQLQRLRYYYAVVECDSIPTAQSIYEACDGAEFEASANVFDLRYIPDDMTFDEDEPRDECDSVPPNYTPIEFLTDALNHSKVRLTWDQTPNDRLEIAKRSFSRQQLEDMDLKAYLASSSSDSDGDDEDKEQLRQKYRSLLPDMNGKQGPQQQHDMQVTFTSGLERGDDQGGDEFESTIDKYRRKEKERRQRRLAKGKTDQAINENPPPQPQQQPQQEAGFDDEFFQDPDKFNKKLKKDRAKEKAQEKIKERIEKEKSQAELELLLAPERVGNDNNEMNHFDMKDIIKGEKLKSKKKLHKQQQKSKRNKEILDAIEKDDFDIDVKDSRLSALYNDHEFAIDPTHSQYKQTSAMKKLLQERQRRRTAGTTTTTPGTKRKRQDNNNNSSDISSLIQSVKGKSKTRR